MKKYDYVLLDWDGNIANTLHIWLEAYRPAFVKRGLNLTDQEIVTTFADIDALLAKRGVYDSQTVVDEAVKRSQHLFPQAELYPDALEVLHTLHERSKRLAIVTATFQRNVEAVLQRYNLAELFDTIVGHDDVTHHKPHPEPLLIALSRLKGEKEKAIMIGDSASDILAAQRAGIDSILFYPPEHEKFYDIDALSQHKPTYTVTDFRKILDIV
jgi:pyrophosphatase PpaX